jgi:hypothetical protein
MRNLLVMTSILCVMFLFTACTFAEEYEIAMNGKVLCQSEISQDVSNVESVMSVGNNTEQIEIQQSGCCSWHGGIWYCDPVSGRWVCQDGTLSPTCHCR